MWLSKVTFGNYLKRVSLVKFTFVEFVNLIAHALTLALSRTR